MEDCIICLQNEHEIREGHMNNLGNTAEMQVNDTVYRNVRTYYWSMEGDNAKKNNDYYCALIHYQKAFKTATQDEVKYLLAKVTCCYRRINRPQTAIEFYNKIVKKFGKEIIDHVVLTSISGAYADLKQWEAALEVADLACSMNDGEVTNYLEAVYNRIYYNTKKAS